MITEKVTISDGTQLNVERLYGITLLIDFLSRYIYRGILTCEIDISDC